MPVWRDAPAVTTFLERAAWRVVWIAAARGAAAGLGVALVLLVAGWLGRGSALAAVGAGAVLALAGSAMCVRAAGTRGRSPATLVEHRAPECRNLLVTAAELIEHPSRVRDYVGERVCQDASRLTSRLEIRRLFPSQNSAVALATAATLWIVAVVALAGRPNTEFGLSFPAGPAIARIDVVVTPPAYAKRPVQTLRDPSRIAALAGSRLQVTVSAEAGTVTLDTIDSSRQPLASTSPRTFTADILASADGFLAFEPATTDGRAGLRRLIGLSVEADRAPRVRVTAPGKDLFLPDARKTLDLAVVADDDLALASLKLKYTKVAGSGENFTFTEGEAVLAIARASDRTWTATGVLPLGALGLEPGDMVVYRAMATDARPGAPPAESDSWVVEITAAGAVAMEGFAVDDERDRYAISQQMVIMKTEQLAARKAAMTAEAFTDEAQNIAAEQRRVRAEFVFMMGGELADAGVDLDQLHEEAEAAGEHDLAAGLLANQGRADLIRAIRSMSVAATSLNAADLPKALVSERAALASLQRAFARSRYILRTLTTRERLDLSRRLTGVLAALTRNTRPPVPAPDNPRLDELRRALARIAALAGAPTLTRDDSTHATAVAQALLRIDATSDAFTKIAAALGDVASALAAGRYDEARWALDRAVTDLAVVTRAELIAAPAAAARSDVSRLEGLLNDALRRRRK